MYLLCCEVFRPELEWLAPAFPDAPVIRYLEQGLHDHPDELRRRLCAAIGELEEEGATRIILGYGLCGRGMTGVTARRATLVMPRVHDCIPVLLGCPQSELGHISRDDSTYWMSAGWLRYSQLEFIRTRRERYDDYLQRFGSENAEFLMAQEREWLANYTNACLIRHESFPRQADVERDARLVAEDSGLPYRSTPGRTDFLRALLAGGTDERFLTLLPGQTVDLDGDGNITAVKAEQIMEARMTVHHQQGTRQFVCTAGEPVAPLLRDAGLLPLPCGLGKCGKCLIYADTAPTDEERSLLGERRLAAGLRLACHTRAQDGLVITVPHAGALKVLTQYADMDYVREPLVRRVPLAVGEATLKDQRSDVQRLLAAAQAGGHELTLEELTALPAQLRSGESLAALLHGEKLLGLRPQGTSHALIVDIGTTTVAALLADLDGQRIVAALGERNAQSPYGADVISRIHREMEWEKAGRQGSNPLQAAICRQIDSMLQRLLAESGVQDVDMLSLTGNTTMLHLLCGLPGEHISKAPFIPVTLEPMCLPAQRLGIRSAGRCFLMPGISSYIGADIVASLLAADAHHPQEPFLLVDLGTNAETVLYADGKLLACSAAAGPCFEGATLSCGMAGQDGAIDAVEADAAQGLRFSTIGGAPAQGICGSGVLDALALLLDAGCVDETGRLEAGDSPLGRRIRDDALLLTETVRFTQRDIREVQLAKAAVRAGMEILLQEAGLRHEDVRRLYLAGGFGSAMRPRSAARIGLIPAGLEQRVHVLGNAASFGALRYVSEKGAQAAAAELIRQTRYIELSAHSGFSESYVEQMIFPAA